MYKGTKEIFELAQVSHDCKLVNLLKELDKVSSNVSSIFSDGDISALNSDIIFLRK